MTARTKLVASIPAAAMLSLALVQVWLVQSAQLSPWKGGGFGMFASTDGGQNRRVRIYLIDGVSEQSATPGSLGLKKLAQQAGTMPTPGMLERLAREVGEQARKQDHVVDRVRVEVWRREFAKVTLAPEQVLLAEATVELGASPGDDR
jgi:hypothetical protein